MSIALVPSCNASVSAQENTVPPKIIQPFKDTFRGKFLIGTAISNWVLQGRDPLSESLARVHFNAFTPENTMKPDS